MAEDGTSASSRSWSIVNRATASRHFGLLRIEGRIREDRRFEDARIIVRFADFEQAFPAFPLLEEGNREFRCRLHLASHLVPNGSHAFAVEARWPDGSRVDLGETRFGIENAGPLAEAVAADLKQFGTAPIIGRYVDSRHFPLHDGLAHAWFNHIAEPPDVPLTLEPASSPEAAQLHLMRWGFAVLDHTIPAATVANFRDEYEAAIDDNRLSYQRGTSQRVHMAHKLLHGRQIWLDANVLAFLRAWFRDEPCACQTLLYINGSQQDAHQDTIHLTPYPSGFMCGVWIALQDVEPDSGELFIYPGSHRAPRIMSADLHLPKVSTDYSPYRKFTTRINEIIATGNYQRLVYRPRLGQILVWHENLIHGGAARLDKGLERHSIVSHYFTRGGIAYYDSRGEAANLELMGE